LTHPNVRVLYDVYGNPPVEENIVDIAGYRNSRPVRVGNAAFDQLQLDCYGEVIDAVSQLAHVVGKLDRESSGLLRDYGEFVCTHWRLPDQGIWEPRGAPRPRTHSRLMCWVALDRLITLHDRGLVDSLDRDRLARERAAIRDDLETFAFHPALHCYTGSIGDPDLDAAVLLMTWYGFHEGFHPRMQATYERIMAGLGAGPGLLYRHGESIAKREGAFWICSFWAVEHLAKGGGSLARATALMRETCGYANDLGLMAEEIDPETGDALGNFPQAYTHVGLISAALSLEERERRVFRGLR
jgi:GH15 family glucan-1,4-alpha-glucosidase